MVDGGWVPCVHRFMWEIAALDKRVRKVPFCSIGLDGCLVCVTVTGLPTIR